MNWQKKVEDLERQKDWNSALNLLKERINKHNEIEAYIRVIYLLHNILLEEDYPVERHDYLAALLKQYFDESKNKFSDDAEYLFFVGVILHIAEWYFGLDSHLKSIEDTLAFKMQKKASELQPENALYKWAYIRTLNNDKKLVSDIKEKIFEESKYLNYLKSKGFPGQYVLEVQLGFLN